jgi:hypothetical protein
VSEFQKYLLQLVSTLNSILYIIIVSLLMIYFIPPFPLLATIDKYTVQINDAILTNNGINLIGMTE